VTGFRLNLIVAIVVVVVFGIVWFIPVYSLIVGSIKTLAEVMGTPVIYPPTQLSLSTLVKVFNQLKTPLINTAVVVIPTSVIATLIGTATAYAIHRRADKLSDTIMLLIAISTYIPYQSILVPLVHVIKALRLYNTLPGIMVGFLIYYTPMAALLMVIFLTSIPKDLIEAAVVDGASDFRVFRKVVLPLLGPGIASTIVFILIMTWNNFFMPLILTRGYDKHITLKIFSYVGQSGTLYNQMFAAALIGSLPPLIVFIFLGRYFIRGLLMLGTGAKG